MRITRTVLFLLAAISSSLLASCTEQASSIGAPYYPDPVDYRSAIRQDTSVLSMKNYTRSTITSAGHTYNNTWASPVMLVGRVELGSEKLDSWGVLQFPTLGGDTLSRTRAIRLILRDINFKYGDTTNSKVDLQVFGEGGGKVSDSTTTLVLTDLTPAPYGSYTGDFPDSAKSQLSISLDTSVKTQLSATSFKFVLVPGASMTNVRGFSSKEAADASQFPALEYSVQTDTGIQKIVRTPVMDMHIVKDQSTAPATEFTLRGGVGQRERLQFTFNQPGDTLTLNSFTTINNATLVLRIDPANSRHSNLAFDTMGPVIVQLLGTDDTNSSYYSNGTKDAADPTLYRFQIRTLVEFWLRNPEKNFGLELRSGFANRSFVSATHGVEDNTLNRWTFYGSESVNPTDRPKLILNYSKLK